jgi:phage-related tail fiber protein
MSTKIMNGLDLQNQKITALADPSAATDAVTKQYVDLYINGLTLKNAVRAATTANITLSGAQTIDGVAVIAGDRVLVKDQSSGSANGIYVAASGSWSRATDADVSAEVLAGMTVFVTEGTVNGDKQYSLTTNNPITLGTTALTFALTAATGTTYTAGNGISLAGNAVTAVATTGVVVNGSGIGIDSTYSGLAKRYSTNVPNSTTATITHSLGTTDVIIQVRDIATGAVVIPDPVIVDANTVNLLYATAPGTGAHRVTIFG